MRQKVFYTVNHTQDRLDVHAELAFTDQQTALQSYEKLVTQINNPTGQMQTLASIRGLQFIDETGSREASKNIIDYHFEAMVLGSMGGEQIHRYVSDIEKNFSVVSVNGVGDEGPIWIDTVQHVCMFSLLPRLFHYLIEARRIDHIVILHEGDREDPRLLVIKSYIANAYGVTLDLLSFSDIWLSELSNMITDSTLFLSMCDMTNGAYSPQIRNPSDKNRESNHIELYYGDLNSVLVECVTDSHTIAMGLGANHVVLDYPTEREVQIRPYDPDVAPRCPIDSWVFWPCLAGPERALI